MRSRFFCLTIGSRRTAHHWKAKWKKNCDSNTEAELRTMMEKQFSIKRLEQVRDLFK
jgi:hypothetical protein